MLAWSGVVLVVVLWAVAARHGGDEDRELRVETQREIARGAAWMDALPQPTGFRPIECESPNSSSDRCWSLTGSPIDALATLAPLAASGGFGPMTSTCDGSITDHGAPDGCRADAGVLLIFATQDVEPSAFDAGADTAAVVEYRDTTTVHLGTVHLGD